MVNLPPPISRKAADDNAPEPFKAAEAAEAVEAPEAIQGAPVPDGEAEDGGGGEDGREAPEDDDDAEDEENAIQGKKKYIRNNFRHYEITQQVHQVQEWLTMGKRPNQIRALCAEMWGLKVRASEQRIHDARKQMVLDCNDMDRKDKVGQMLQQLEQVLEQALDMRQGSNAIGAIRLQADLLQLLTRQN